MNNTIMTIMTHTNFMDRALFASVHLFEYACNGDIEKIDQAMESRDKLISILQKLQDIVTLNIDKMDSKDKKEVDPIIKAWSFDISEWIETIAELDTEILKVLDQQKQRTTEELSSVFKNQNKFKGYNLKNVK